MKYLTNRWMEKVRFRVYNRPESKQQFPVVPSQFTDYTELQYSSDNPYTFYCRFFYILLKRKENEDKHAKDNTLYFCELKELYLHGQV